jgi:VWFA-related protein
MSETRKIVLIIGGILGLSTAGMMPRTGIAQKDLPNTTFSTDVKVINLFATVRNKQGEIVRDLTRDDFTLQEDGRLQTIRYFSKDTDLPLTLGLLVDVSGSQRRVLDQERAASHDFFEHILREDKDQAFVIQFQREVELLQDLTSSRQKLEAALQSLNSPQLQRAGSGGSSGGGGGYPGGGYPGGGYPRQGSGYPSGGQARGNTSLYDAVYLAATDMMQKQRGRKAVIVLSNGVDNASKESLSSAIESAQRADTLFYSIYFADDQAYGNQGLGGFGGWGGMGRRGGRRMPVERPDGKKILQRISRETGASFFEVSKKQPLDKIYDLIEEELRNEYSIGYTSDRPEEDGSYRKIALTVRQKDLTVLTRDGYYAVK